MTHSGKPMTTTKPPKRPIKNDKQNPKTTHLQAKTVVTFSLQSSIVANVIKRDWAEMGEREE